MQQRLSVVRDKWRHAAKTLTYQFDLLVWDVKEHSLQGHPYYEAEFKRMHNRAARANLNAERLGVGPLCEARCFNSNAPKEIIK